MNADLYNAVKSALGNAIEDVFDTKLPDAHSFGANATFATPVIVYWPISDVPETAIDTKISGREQRITLEVQAYDLTTARAVKESLISGIHGFHGGTVTSCLFENCGPELYDSELVPPRYCLPIDFLVTD